MLTPCVRVCMCVNFSVVSLCNPMAMEVHGIFPGKNTGVGSHFLLQKLFLTQGSNPGLLHCRQILHRLRHQGSPAVCISVFQTPFLIRFCFQPRPDPDLEQLFREFYRKLQNHVSEPEMAVLLYDYLHTNFLQRSNIHQKHL